MVPHSVRVGADGQAQPEARAKQCPPCLRRSTKLRLEATLFREPKLGVILMNRLFILLFIAVAALVRPLAEERPNFILCMADDQGWGDTGYNGHPLLKTPVMVEMARTGLRFAPSHPSPAS